MDDCSINPWWWQGVSLKEYIVNGAISGMLEAGRRDILGPGDLPYFPQSFHKSIYMKGWP